MINTHAGCQGYDWISHPQIHLRFVYPTAWAKIPSTARFNQYALGEVRDLRSLSLLLSIGENGRYCLLTTQGIPDKPWLTAFAKHWKQP